MTPKQSIHPSVMAVIMLIMTVRVTVICSSTSPSLFHALSILTVMKGRRPIMNPLNYASLEASKRLVEAGIVLETEAVWHLQGDNETYFLQAQGSSAELCVRWGDFPAPSMTEVWRELPDHIDQADLLLDKSSGGDTYAGYVTPADVEDGKEEKEVHGLLDINPTDALIDLLIWVRKEKV
jgi:hypothetical protein